MLDVSADRGWLVTSLQVITLLQMVVQGRWWHDSSLLALPHIELYHLPCFRYAAYCFTVHDIHSDRYWLSLIHI